MNLQGERVFENAFCKMCILICEKFCPNKDSVAGYDN